MKPLKKILFVSVFLVLGVMILLLVHDNNSLKYEKNKQDIKGGTMSWLQALCDKDYSTCDSYIASDGFKLTGFDSTSQAVLNPVSSKIYYQFLNYIVDSIQSIKVLSIKENTGTGYTEYEIEVVFNSYEVINELTVDEAKVNSLMDDLYNRKITDDEFYISIQDIYLESFKDCSIKDNDNVTSKVLTLSEKEDKDGVVYVYNTKTFIEGLISDEMYKNLELYQNNIKAKVDTVLRQY